jgi:hypothetical protein
MLRVVDICYPGVAEPAVAARVKLCLSLGAHSRDPLADAGFARCIGGLDEVR